MNETKKCIHCQSEMDKKAKICPTCRKSQIATWRKVVGVPVLIVAIIITLGTIASLGGDTTNSLSNVNNNVNTNTNSEKITLEEFNRIQTGMTYDEVVSIIGSNGTLNSESEIMEIKTQLYSWYGKDGISNANVTFQDNKVIAKAQLGLK